jgi:hypothetical protein
VNEKKIYVDIVETEYNTIPTNQVLNNTKGSVPLTILLNGIQEVIELLEVTTRYKENDCDRRGERVFYVIRKLLEDKTLSGELCKLTVSRTECFLTKI